MLSPIVAFSAISRLIASLPFRLLSCSCDSHREKSSPFFVHCPEYHSGILAFPLSVLLLRFPSQEIPAFLCSLSRISFGYPCIPFICPALRGPRKRSWRFGVHFAIPIARNPRLYTLHFHSAPIKSPPKSDFICINAKKVVTLRAKNKEIP